MEPTGRTNARPMTGSATQPDSRPYYRPLANCRQPSPRAMKALIGSYFFVVTFSLLVSWVLALVAIRSIDLVESFQQ